MTAIPDFLQNLIRSSPCVVEHISDDALAVGMQNPCCAKWKLVILVPAFPGLYNSLDHELGHYRRYTKTRLKRLIASAGMELTACRYFNAAAIPGWWFSGNILKEKVISRSKLQAYNLLVPIFRIMDWFLTPVAGVSVIAVSKILN
jgi:hypothetical protein